VTRAFHLTANDAQTREALAHHQHVLANNRKLSSNPNESGSLIYRPPLASGDPDDTWLIGTPEQVVRRLKSLQSRGIEYVLLLDTTGDCSSLETFAAEIMPQFDAPGPRGDS
jgi:alkanesulfonate monooxygenase SsuD/methylene tetrahydromethanopterin reductase-like flavin-dependent oxidoreductase (luciferase family)